ncbi:MAG: DUF1854 domain-containing protein [Gammaproteobacteria bacterium]|nr:DUF1854 domain-containing protein [Gammaproteobacteria bacterium]
MDSFKFLKNQSGHLQVLREGAVPLSVKPKRCFPWSELNHYVSIRDMKNNEVVLIRDLDDLDDESRQAVCEALNETAFVFQIERIVDIQVEFEIRFWQVITDQGEYCFQTKLDEWPIKLAQGQFIIKDVAGNLYSVANIDCLDDQSRQFLWAYLD